MNIYTYVTWFGTVSLSLSLSLSLCFCTFEKQLSRCWYMKLGQTLKNINVEQSQEEPCLFMDRNRKAILLVYVDDIMITAENEMIIEKIKNQLNEEFQVKDLGEIDRFCGMTIKKTKDGFSVDQESMIEELVKQFKIEDESKKRNVPLQEFSDLSKEEIDINIHKKVRSLIG